MPSHFILKSWIVTCNAALFDKSSDKELLKGIMYLKLQIQSKRNRNNTILNFITYLAAVSLKYKTVKEKEKKKMTLN